MPSQRDRLRVGAAVLGVVAMLAVVGRITGPDEPFPAETDHGNDGGASPARDLPERWVTAQLEVAHGGGPLIFGAGSLWVGAWRDREVVRIDPRSNRVAARFPAGGPDPAGLAVDATTIWVVHPDTDEVVRLDPRTGRVVARIRLDPLPFEFAPGDRRFRPSLVAVGAGAGWVASARGAVARIDAASNRVVAVIKLARQGAEGIAVAGRIVWVAEGGHGMARIDAATNRLLRTVRLDVHAERVATDGGTIWVGGRSTDPSFEVGWGCGPDRRRDRPCPRDRPKWPADWLGGRRRSGLDHRAGRCWSGAGVHRAGGEPLGHDRAARAGGTGRRRRRHLGRRPPRVVGVPTQARPLPVQRDLGAHSPAATP